MSYRHDIPQDAKFQKKLNVAQDYIKKSKKEFEQQFLEVQRYPLLSLTLTAGAWDEDKTERGIHLSLKGEVGNFPTSPGDKSAVEKHGHNLHCSRIEKKRMNNASFKVKPMSMKAYKKYHQGLLMIIDHTIQDTHGVECYLDGNMQNHEPANVVMLHICDVLNIAKCQRLNIPFPDVVVGTSKFNTIPTTIKNRLTDFLIENSLVTFILNESDHFYSIYAYYGNYSYIPIRLGMTSLEHDMPNAAFFMSNDGFVAHQRGKLQEMNLFNTSVMFKEIYKSI